MLGPRQAGLRVAWVNRTGVRRPRRVPPPDIRVRSLSELMPSIVPDVPLVVIESPYRAFVAPMVAYLQSALSSEDGRVIVILPAFLAHRPWQKFLHNRDILRLRPHLKQLGVQVVDYKYDLEAAPVSAT